MVIPNANASSPFVTFALPFAAKEVEKFGLFLSQQPADQTALTIRDVGLSEKPLVQQNVFLADKYVEGGHHASPTATD
jgi:hypothetical protein